MNLLHDIPTGEEQPKKINAVIEVESGSRDKYEYSEKYESFVLDRILYSSVIFPVDYGFIPQTWYDDDDPLDVMVLSFEPLEVGCLVKVRTIGVLIIDDEKGEDSKILSVIDNDPRFADVKDIKDVQQHILNEIQEFFETYKRLEPHKWVKFKKWGNAKEAEKIISYSIELYKKRKTKS